jgi:aryl-alcohol dehydrogenase-like predicted oxidoreductase
MKYARLGTTDIEVSRVCMGCWAIVGDETWGPQREEDAFAAIDASLDAGVNFFDTAETYGDGRSEEMLGRALEPHRNDAVIATKVSSGHMRRDDVIRACEQSLRRLRTDAIDLYQLHWPSRDVPFEESAEALRTLLDQGKIRAAGISNFGPVDLDRMLDILPPVTNQIAYSLLFRAPETELLDLCRFRDVSVLCYSPLAAGLLTGKFDGPDDVPDGRARTRHFGKDRPGVRHGEDGAEAETFEALGRIKEVARGEGVPMAHLALAWLLRRPAVGVVIAGARNARQARQNAGAADLVLSDEVMAELDAATGALKDALGTNLDMWQSESRIQ